VPRTPRLLLAAWRRPPSLPSLPAAGRSGRHRRGAPAVLARAGLLAARHPALPRGPARHPRRRRRPRGRGAAPGGRPDPDSAELHVALALALAHSGRLDGARRRPSARWSWTATGRRRPTHRCSWRASRSAAEPEKAALALREAIRVETALAEAGDRATPRPGGSWRSFSSRRATRRRPRACWRTRPPGSRASRRVPEMGGRCSTAASPPGGTGAAALGGDRPRRRRGAAPARPRAPGAPERRRGARALPRRLRIERRTTRRCWRSGRSRCGPRRGRSARVVHPPPARRSRPARGPAPDRLRMARRGLPADALATARDGLAESGPEPRLKLGEGLALRSCAAGRSRGGLRGGASRGGRPLVRRARVAGPGALACGRHAERSVRSRSRSRATSGSAPRDHARPRARAGRRGKQAQALLRRSLADLERAGTGPRCRPSPRRSQPCSPGRGGPTRR